MYIYKLVCACVLSCFSHIWLFATPWTVDHQVPLSSGFSRQEYWSGLPFPSPGDLPDPWIKPSSPALQADSLLSESPGKLQKISSVLVHSVMSNSATPWYSPPGSSFHGIFQARTLEWVAISSSRGIFLTWGWNTLLLHLLYWQMDSYYWAPPEKPQITGQWPWKMSRSRRRKAKELFQIKGD